MDMTDEMHEDMDMTDEMHDEMDMTDVMHGDMDISTIDEQPENRIPITTKIVPKEKIKDAYKFMENEMQNGRQCFVVYPLIEESEKLDLKAAESGYKMLNEKIFPNYIIYYRKRGDSELWTNSLSSDLSRMFQRPVR